MSKLRNFIGEIPKLCGAKQADVRGLRNLLMFDYEIDNSDGVLNRKNFTEDPDSRLDVLFDFDGDEDKKKYCRALLNVKMYTGYGDDNSVSENLEVLESSEEDEEITSVYSLSDATASSVEAARWS